MNFLRLEERPSKSEGSLVVAHDNSLVATEWNVGI